MVRLDSEVSILLGVLWHADITLQLAKEQASG